MMNKKEHLTEIGLQSIINIKASMNRAITYELKKEFPLSKKRLRPEVIKKIITPPMPPGRDGRAGFMLLIRLR
jgi:hypothetical protein